MKVFLNKIVNEEEVMKEIIDQINLFDEVVIISSSRNRRIIQEYIFKQKLLLNINYKTFSEVVDDWYGVYSKEALVELVQREGVHPEIAQILLDNTFYVSNSNYSNPKISKLREIKSQYSRFLKREKLAINLYKNKKIFIIHPNYRNTLFIKLLPSLESISDVRIINFAKKREKELILYRFDSIKEEVEALAHEISHLLSKGIEPKNIKIHTLDNNYLTVFHEIFQFYNIDINFKNQSVLFEFPIARTFLDYLTKQSDSKPMSSLHKSLEFIKNTYQLNNNQFDIILKSLINIVNQYTFFDGPTHQLAYFLEHEFKNNIIQTSQFDNVIELSNLLDEYITEEDYVFFLGFNQDILPRIVRDEDYLSDVEKEFLGFKTSRDINKTTKDNLLRTIDTSKNIYLSYALNSLDEKLQKSSFIEVLKETYQVNEINYQNETNISYSKKRTEFNLAKMLDEYYRYDVKSEKLHMLYYNLGVSEYKQYQNDFTQIDRDFLADYLENGFRLSFTAIDTFYNCSFKFYLERVLKINLNHNERALMIGNYFHYVLEKLLLNNYTNWEMSLDDITNSFINEFKIAPTKKDIFYFSIFKEHIKKIYPIIKEQFNRSKFKLHSLEANYEVLLDYNYKPILSGKIDKVLVCEIDNEPYAIVIDYKTGNNEFDYNNCYYGLDLQTLIYFYLLNDSLPKPYIFAGAYLQSLFPSNPFLHIPKQTYGEQLNDYLHWNGYTIKDFRIIEHIDPLFNSSGFLKGIKQKKDLDFHANSLKKVLTIEEFNQLQMVLKTKISECVEDISQGNFKINPKRSSKLDSCRYCPFKDVCFRKEQDYVRLNVFKNLDFIRNEVDNNDSEQTS